MTVLRSLWLFALAFSCLSTIPPVMAQGTTAFTYQGQLRDGGTNANGNYSLVFKLHDALTSGNQVGPTVTKASQFITNGQFNAALDFGEVFDGSARWLEISVEGNVLTPRTPVAPTPYALHASTASSLSSSSWEASVDEEEEILDFRLNGTFVMGLSSGGVQISGGLDVGSIKIGPAGGSISSDGQGGLQTTHNLTVSNLFFTGNTIQFPSRSGAIITVSAGGDFTFDNNLSITALGGLSLPAPGGPRAISANNQGITVDGVSLSSANGVVLPNGSGGFVSITASGSSILIPLGQLTVNGPITCTSLNQTSDRAAKENFTPIDGQKILEQVASLPISRWNFKTDTEAQHVGPMAQDFHAAFSLGTDDKHINTVDQGGIALAAIQGLNAVVKEKDAKIAALQQRLENLEQAVAALTQKQNGGAR